MNKGVKMERGGRYQAHDLTEPTSDLEKYAKEVLQTLIKEGIPPTPSNFDAYFDKLLDSKPPALRKAILKLIELEESDDDHSAMMEHYIKETFGNIKTFLQHINTLYKSLRHLETVIDKRSYEIEAINDESGIKNLLLNLKRDIQSMNNLIKNNAQELKETFTATTELVQEVQKQTIHDERFGVYKKNYLIKKMHQEVKLIKEFRHESTLMTVCCKEEILTRLKTPKIRQLVLRTVARLLLKTSRRSDLVAHYDKGVFTILMRHTPLDKAKLAAERLKDLVNNTNFFIADEEVILEVDIGIARIDPDRSVEQTIVCALEALELAKHQKDEPCGVCPQDVEI